MRRLVRRVLGETRTAWRAIRATLVLPIMLLAGGQRVAAEDAFRVANGHLEIGLGHDHGDLVALTDAHTHQNFAGTASSGAGLWELALFPADKTLSPADAKAFRCQPLSGRQPALQLT